MGQVGWAYAPRVGDERGIFFSVSPVTGLVLLVVSAIITAICFLPNWSEAMLLFAGDDSPLDNGCKPGYTPAADGFSCSATTWWTVGRIAGLFLVINLVLFVVALIRSRRQALYV